MGKSIFSFRVKEGSFKEMVKILRFPETTGQEVDRQVCRVTVTAYDVNSSLKKQFIEQYKNDHVYQIKLFNNNEREFIIMASMLDSLEDPIVKEDFTTQK